MDFKHTALPLETKLPKLIRDNIPDIIQKNDNKVPKVIVTKNDSQFLFYLLKKLVEEAIEAQLYKDKEDLVKELADIKEVTITIMKLLNITEDYVEKVRMLKKEKNGGFEKRLVLEEI